MKTILFISSFFISAFTFTREAKITNNIDFNGDIQIRGVSNFQGKFFLQDVRTGYKTKLFLFNIGQFVSQYGLQRLQSDYKLPSVERVSL